MIYGLFFLLLVFIALEAYSIALQREAHAAILSELSAHNTKLRDFPDGCSFAAVSAAEPRRFQQVFRRKMKHLLLLALFAGAMFGQQQYRWAATTGDVVQAAATSASTIQQPATNAQQVYLDQIVVYCSVACNVTQAANGAAATVTAGTVTPILPTQANWPIPFKFYTASDVGAGTAQGGLYHLAAGATTVFCLSTTCGAAQQVMLGTGGTSANYSVTISSITGTSNVTYYGRAQ